MNRKAYTVRYLKLILPWLWAAATVNAMVQTVIELAHGTPQGWVMLGCWVAIAVTELIGQRLDRGNPTERQLFPPFPVQGRRAWAALTAFVPYAKAAWATLDRR